jgi:hypothetical protein
MLAVAARVLSMEARFRERDGRRTAGGCASELDCESAVVYDRTARRGRVSQRGFPGGSSQVPPARRGPISTARSASELAPFSALREGWDCPTNGVDAVA